MLTVQDSMGLLNYFTECGYIARPYRPPFTADPCVAFELSDAGDLFHMGLDCAAIADTGPGRLLPWLPVAFGLGIALYFTLPVEPPLIVSLLLRIVYAAAASSTHRRVALDALGGLARRPEGLPEHGRTTTAPDAQQRDRAAVLVRVVQLVHGDVREQAAVRRDAELPCRR